jgi:predicted nucleic acid-binding protein
MDCILRDKIPFGINHYIYQELLQGAATEKEFIVLQTYLDSQTFYELKRGRDSFAAAAKIYFKCRRAGITVKSTIDLLIAETALEHNIALFQNDTDFAAIKRVVPQLHLY